MRAMETKVERLRVMREQAMARHEAAKWEVWLAEEAMKNLLSYLNECVQEVASTSSELEAVELKLREEGGKQNLDKPLYREGGHIWPRRG